MAAEGAEVGGPFWVGLCEDVEVARERGQGRGGRGDLQLQTIIVYNCVSNLPKVGDR